MIRSQLLTALENPKDRLHQTAIGAITTAKSSTLRDLLNDQKRAGEKYQVAVDALYSAYIELAALDAALMNSSINDRAADVRTFAHLTQDLRPFDHPIFASLKLPGDWREAVAKRRDELVTIFDGRLLTREMEEFNNKAAAYNRRSLENANA